MSIPIEEKVLDDRAQVMGVIYCIEHTASGCQYVGQTVTHRLNKGKYRPYGVRRRFAEHCSNATRNTKQSQSSSLYNAIREHGPAAFTYAELKKCDLAKLDDLERYYIELHECLHPNGYNLTTGGKEFCEVIAHVPTPPRAQPGPRGGCTHRTAATRERMSNSVKASLESVEARQQRAQAATAQHNAAKASRFTGVSINHSNLDQYIMIRKHTVIVRAGGQETRFAGKNETSESLVARAKEFLSSLSSLSTTETIATLPNCSGNP